MKPLGAALRLLRGTAAWPPAVGQSPADVAFAENKWRLLRYRVREPRYRVPVLLVPSLINRHYVLDLIPGRSVVEYLASRGHPVFAIDWGAPGDEDRYLGFDDVVDGYLGRAVRRVAATSPAGQVHLLGYCLGGTLAAIHAAARPERIATFTALATPIDFDRAGIMARWVRTASFDVDALAAAFANVPWPLMQAAFRCLRPTLGLAKLVGALDRGEEDGFLESFFALERWGTDNVSFPGEVYRRYIAALYRDNQLVKDELRLSGRPARLASIRCPVHLIAFEDDHIVPIECALPLADKVGSRDVVVRRGRGGHVGAVVSRRAAGGLWLAMSEFWASREVAARAAAATAPRLAARTRVAPRPAAFPAM
jgi:polyhydroxyalkanoate synthase